MKVLIVSSYFYPEIGAAASRIGNLADGLSERGADVNVLAPLPNYPLGKIFSEYRKKIFCEEQIHGHRVFRYRTYNTVSKNPFLRAIGMMSFAVILWCFGFRGKLANSYDLVIVQSPPLPVAYSAIRLFKGIFKKKVILNVSDLWPLSAVELGVMRENSLICRMFSRMERFIYHKADGIMGQSEEIIEYVRRFEPQKRYFLYRNLKSNTEL